ncbi:Rieske 2Fe-2S domain-containing protein [Pseudonocardia petroleophila]|uniref:Rieske 2Fe-2S domain-containing protein n=1 Tax=Pseudonocardia petroleophila TaxID=37331 RepID=A0A7G7MSD1_9PSEU|nr:Rieske 2Fe-2S domain-containing protein [Pseudonocardia petroleophila]
MQQKLSVGTVPQWILTDPDVYRAEVERVFARTWYYLGHESEIPEPGDYVTRWYVHDPVLLVRDRGGEIRAYLNSCMHRGTVLCTADSGNKGSFTCPYHGWTYNLRGELTGIVAGDRVYGEEMNRDEWKLRTIPRVETYHGLVFASLDRDVVPLREYLGDLAWYLDILVGRSDNKMEVRGAPFRWVVKANWKIGAENFGGDAYHTAMTHRSTVELGLSPKDPMFASYGHQVVMNDGHGLNVITPSPVAPPIPPFQGQPEQLWPEFERNLTPEQLEVFRGTAVIDGTCFPNLSFLSPMHGTGGHAHLTNFLTLRQWRPVGPDTVEIWSWFLTDRDAPEEFKEESYKRYVNTFGPAGTLEQDDTEIWTRITDASNGLMARDKNMNYNNVMNYVMGLGRVEVDPAWPGPGTAYPTCYLEAVQRGFYEQWNKLMVKD